MKGTADRSLEERVLILAPTARDAATSREILDHAGIVCRICRDMEETCIEIERGCGAAILTQEAILSDRAGRLAGVLSAQPPWSDLPLIALTPAGADSVGAGLALEAVGQMTLMKRPVPIQALVSTVRASLRDRARQYASRDYFVEREEQAEALRERDERFRATFAHAAVGMAHTTLDGRFLEVNAAFRSIAGRSEEGLLRLSLEDITHPDDREMKRELIRRMVAGAIPSFVIEKRYIREDGGVVWVKNSVSLIRDSAGAPNSLVLLTEDVTERKRAEEALRDNEEKYRTLAENVQQLFWTWRPDGQCDYLSAQWIDYTGIPEEEQLGLRWAHLVIHPDDRARAEALWKEAVASRGDYDLEYRIKGRDDVYRWFKTRGTPIRDRGGAIVKWFGTCTEIDAQVKAQEAIRRHASRLRRLSEIGSRVNVAHDIRSVLGMITEEARNLIGTHISAIHMDLGPGSSIEAASLSDKHAAWRGRDAIPADSELCSMVRRSNRMMRLSPEELDDYPRWDRAANGVDHAPMRGWLAAPLIGRDGRNIGLIHLSDKDEGAFNEDDESLLLQLAQTASIAAENAQLYEQLRKNDRRKDEFLAMLAHELRNPLAAINNAVQITTMCGVHDQIEWSMDVINRQIKHLTRLIDDLLDVSRITRGKIQLRKEILDPYPILHSAIETVRPLIEVRRHELTVSLRPGLRMEADPTRLEQILVNLLANAAKYTEDGGSISLDASQVGDEIVIKVRDNGVGIPAEAMPQMFELFAQGDRTLARSEGGLGIGLTLVRSLAEMHGGSIAATSEGLGKGSEFVVRLPAARAAAGGGPGPESRKRAETRPTNGARVLVVDDNRDMAKGLETILKLAGHDVRTAFDGEAAIEEARRHRPDYVLLDIGLPGQDGYQVTSKLRGEAFGKDAVIIAVSGYGQEEDRRRSRTAGFDDHLVKPVDFDLLLSLLSRRKSEFPAVSDPA